MPSTLQVPWLRARRCPLCKRAGCLVSSPTRPDAVVCRHTPSAVPVGTIGWLHELRPGPPWARWRVSLAKLTRETGK